MYDKLRNTDRMTIRLDGFFVRARGGGGFDKFCLHHSSGNLCTRRRNNGSQARSRTWEQITLSAGQKMILQQLLK